MTEHEENREEAHDAFKLKTSHNRIADDAGSELQLMTVRVDKLSVPLLRRPRRRNRGDLEKTRLCGNAIASGSRRSCFQRLES